MSAYIVINKYNYKFIDKTIDYFSKYTSRFHIMNLMHCEQLSCNKNEKSHFNEITVPSLNKIAEDKKLSVSLLKNLNHSQSYQFQKAHIDCLAGYTTLVISSDCTIYPCDVAPIKIGKWESYGDLKVNYKKSVEMWKKRKIPWCCESF